MIAHFAKRTALVSILCLFGAAGITGCVAEPVDSAEDEVELMDDEAGELAPQANCKAQCVMGYHQCLGNGIPMEICAESLHFCIDVCNDCPTCG